MVAIYFPLTNVLDANVAYLISGSMTCFEVTKTPMVSQI